MPYYFKIILILCVLSLLSCGQNQILPVEPRFYFWKSQFQLKPTEKNALEELQLHNMYIKLFDVDWDFSKYKALPIASIQNLKPEKIELKIIPTVFITNRTLSHLDEKKLGELADNIYKKTTSLMQGRPFEEIQWDCDWTVSTQSKFFNLLAFLKEKFPPNTIHSCTIRLHQIKYPEKTGIPPVDRGMLMFYNMGTVSDPNSTNSILDLDIAVKYVGHLKHYPLALDVALPIFGWAVHFRDGEFLRIINQVGQDHFLDADRFVKINDENYEVKKSTYLNGVFLYKKDKLRLESVDHQLLQSATAMLKAHLKDEQRCVAFYHLDSLALASFHYEELRNIYQTLD